MTFLQSLPPEDEMQEEEEVEFNWDTYHKNALEQADFDDDDGDDWDDEDDHPNVVYTKE